MGKYDKLIEELKKANDDPEGDESDEAGDAGDEAGADEAKSVSVDVEKLADKLGDKIADAIAAKKDLSDVDKNQLKGKLFNAKNGFQAIQYPSDIANLTKEEKIVTFFKSMLNRHRDPEADKVFKALVEGTDADGGYLVPDELSSEVFRILPDIAVMRRAARVIPMASDTLLLNSLTAKPVAYWTAEYASKATTSADFNQVTLNANDLVCLLPITHQLIADANINIVQFVIELFTEAIAIAEDKAFFTGSGSGQPRGINQETLTQVDAVQAMTFDHVISVIHALPQRVRNSTSAAFVAGNYGIQLLRTIKDSQGRYIWSPGDPNNGSVERIYGYPIYENNDISDKEVYFGDWKYYIIGDRQQITVESTREGGDAWRRNATEIKAVERVDGRAVITGAFAKIVNAHA